ncbi:NAD(P)(+) transhydrogenase (Re/Si-specific) subunit beta [Pseudoxanthomonas koreensis]|uniref:NAD(P)(+) transhydrogenase (Re/Si-specific) subunit beta n=1 Tax=Pseudoxanthomonas koreensis TaxID=266061 RepID=UPI001390A393|nr:NAD(P)(+) transhydrogenase (Re/Si-specific) subunit beta [Pseudoxanthomonas koreensis]KAF1691030.1 NAD(P) transhydrogenase subunit beta [Pseudoxanthomonas koreensis]
MSVGLDFRTWLVGASYLVAATLFLLGLQRMASPATARSGIQWAGVGMLVATFATFFLPGLHNIPLMVVGIVLGTVVTWIWGKKVAITDMPQMVALFNGMGGGSAAGIGAMELVRWSAAGTAAGAVPLTLALLGALIGSVSLTGSIIAWAKLDGRMDKRYTFPGQQWFNAAVAVATVVCAIVAAQTLAMPWIVAFFVLALALGVLMTLPIGGADMPVVISLYNAFTGLAVAFEGYVLGNEALIIAGMMVGAAGILLTRLMAKAMNRPISGVLFGSFGGGGQMQEIAGAQKPIEAGDVAAMMAYAERVVIVPGYGLAVAQAQHKIWELAQRLIERGVKVKFAIHPVAGRMPGHMNVLLAEAGVPYDLIADMDDINPEFPNTDVSLVIGANDVVNPVAKTDPASPIYGMPILDVVESKNTIVIKRGKGTGFAGIENALFYADNTRMLYGDGAEMAGALVSELKALDGGGH